MKTNIQKTQFDGIIFNFDGTLINTRGSYRQVVEMTVNNYMKQTVVDMNDVYRIKNIVGYSNDWDTTYALVKMISNKIPRGLWHLKATELLPINREDTLFKQIYAMFQTSYLGSEQFERIEEGQKAPFSYSPGLISMQQLYVDPALIKEAQKTYKISIASECPRAELLLSLKQLGLYGKDYFTDTDLVTQDDVLKSLPNPEPLLKAKEMMKAEHPIYIGDTISDAEAANQANMAYIHVGNQNVRDGNEPVYINEILKLLI